MGKKKIRRNDPCPCGSGQKYKKCHGRSSVPALAFPSAQEQIPGTVIAPLPLSAEEDITSPVRRRDGKTPRWLKRLVENGVRDVFDRQLKERRGELCLYISVSVTRLLKLHNISARVVAGSAAWKNYPLQFKWKGRAEFHAWVETEFGELVDLGCDDFHRRRGLPFPVPPGPPSCWDNRENLMDRKYVEVPDGAIAVDVYASDEAHLESATTLLREFVSANKKTYRDEYGE